MNSLFLALALASTGNTGDTGDTGEVPTTAATDTSAEADTGTEDTSAASDTASAGDTATVGDTATGDAAPVTAAALTGETGGLGCQSAGHGPTRLVVLIGLTAVLRRRNQRPTPCCPHHGPDGHR